MARDVGFVSQSCLEHAYHRVLWEAFAKDKTFLYFPSESFMSVARFASVFRQLADKYGFEHVDAVTAESSGEEDALALLKEESLCFYLLDFFQLNEVCGQLLLANDENVQYSTVQYSAVSLPRLRLRWTECSSSTTSICVL